MLYADLTAALSTLLTIAPTDASFLAILPRAVDYAEQRLYRDLDLDATSTRLSGGALGLAAALTAGNRNLVITTGTFVVLTGVNVVTPVGAPLPDSGTRSQLVRMSWDALDAFYGGPVPAGMPRFYALQDAATIAVGPWPDQAYPVELLGTIRPAPLSAANTSTPLSLYFPDLLVAAAMIFMAGYSRDYGQQSDDPQLAQSWEAQYAKLLTSAQAEEARKRAMPMAPAG